MSANGSRVGVDQVLPDLEPLSVVSSWLLT